MNVAGKAGPDPVDIAVGGRLRMARLEARISQSAVAVALGVTFQQVQKYEKGTNRIAPSRLVVAAKLTGKPVAWFYDEAAVPPGALVTRLDYDIARKAGQLPAPARRALDVILDLLVQVPA
jgi:transcriptional regulator with XRE-family HTH domain